MNKSNHSYPVCLVILLLLSGCRSTGSESDVATQVAPPIVATAATVPALDSPLESPLQPSATALIPCLSLIEPSGNTVCGYIISQIDGGPVAGRPVYLAEALFSADGSVVFSSLDQSAAPQGTTDGKGMFYVVDVPPNMYFLMLDEFPQPTMLQEADNPTNDLFVDWRQEGREVDLGIIPANVPSIPTP